MTAAEIYAIKPDKNGWRLLPNGNKVKIGDSVRLGNYVSIGKSAEIGNYVSIGGGAKIGDGAKIGNDAKISSSVKIDDNLEILSGFTSLSLTDKWVVNPYSVGQIRCGCFIGTYRELLERSSEEWLSHSYTTEQIDLVKNFVRFCQTNEHLMLKEKNR